MSQEGLNTTPDPKTSVLQHNHPDNSYSKVQPFDFRRPDRISKSQIRAIEMLHENFARGVASSLSAYLRTYLSISLIGTDQMSYAEFIDTLPATTCMACLTLEPQEGTAAIEINPSLVFPMLEILLGGTGKAHSTVKRELTEIEQTLMDGLFRLIVHDLSEAWKSVGQIGFRIQSVNTEPQFLQIMAPNDTILRLRLEMRVAESTGVINLAIPALMLDMMRQKFDHQRPVKESSPEDQSRLLDLLQSARVEVDARLLDQQILARDVLTLRVGDVLTFDTVIDAPVDLVFNGRRHLRGQVISLGKKRGFAVTDARSTA